MSKLLKPTIKQIRRYVKKFNDRNETRIAERAIRKLFAQYPRNINLEDILLKVSIVNSITKTNIYNVHGMAMHIKKLKIDQLLRKEKSCVVTKIAKTTFTGKKRYLYSFATKYCAWHKPQGYPIFDQYVGKMLWEYQKKDTFFKPKFKKKDLKDYASFKNIFDSFIQCYQLKRCNYRSIDHFLWSYGRQRFSLK